MRPAQAGCVRNWRPRLVCFGALALAVAWNVTPLAASFAHATGDPAAKARYWTPAIRYLHRHLGPSYRVEAVDTEGHWAAVYLPRAGIPLTRGWFRQDDFPQNEVLYDNLTGATYRAWLRSLGVRYVVLTDAPTDYSAKREALLIQSGHSGLTLVRHDQTYELTLQAETLAVGGAKLPPPAEESERGHGEPAAHDEDREDEPEGPPRPAGSRAWWPRTGTGRYR